MAGLEGGTLSNNLTQDQGYRYGSKSMALNYLNAYAKRKKYS